uniref:Uncharacterized protein n=1 Tax=Knipowitschia caucasica TaxID=637954 RepID=A0AAV2JLM5_KNICA
MPVALFILPQGLAKKTSTSPRPREPQTTGIPTAHLATGEAVAPSCQGRMIINIQTLSDAFRVDTGLIKTTTSSAQLRTSDTCEPAIRPVMVITGPFPLTLLSPRLCPG